MIKESTSARASQEEEYVRLDEEMERNAMVDPTEEPKEDAYEEDGEPPLISSVLAVDQLKNGAAAAAAFFSWGFGAVKEKANELSESEAIKNVLESTRPQREAVSATASSLWEGTKPQREEISKGAASLGEKVQPHFEKFKAESVRAFDSLSSTVNDLVAGQQTPATQAQQSSTTENV